MTSEANLVEAARGGDTRAFDRLVELHQAQIYRLMVRACHHPDDAADVASEAFGRAYEKLQQFEGRSSFVSWLGRIASNLCFRKQQTKTPDTVSLEEGDLPDNDTPEKQVMRQETRRIVRAALASLPEPDQSVLRLRDIEELSGAQTAARLNLSLPAVKARLHRARKMLRARLSVDLFGSGATPISDEALF